MAHVSLAKSDQFSEWRLASKRMEKYPTIKKNFVFSCNALKVLREGFLNEFGSPDEERPFFLTVCGSLARFEASSSSDLDYLLIFKEEPSQAEIENAKKSINNVIGSAPVEYGEFPAAPFNQPNEKGVFKGFVLASSLVDRIGSSDELYQTISQRMLLLLEAQSLWNEAAFDKFQTQLVAAYAGDVANDPTKHFVLLINDLIRYFRMLCVNYHEQKENENGKWPIRNVKLRHSRVLMYTSLLAVLGELGRFKYAKETHDKKALLLDYVGLPPMERLIRIYDENEDDNLFRLLGLYDTFLQTVSNPETRKNLQGLEYQDRYTEPCFSKMKANSDALAAELRRLFDARIGTWSDRFFEYLLL